MTGGRRRSRADIRALPPLRRPFLPHLQAPLLQQTPPIRALPHPSAPRPPTPLQLLQYRPATDHRQIFPRSPPSLLSSVLFRMATTLHPATPPCCPLAVLHTRLEAPLLLQVGSLIRREALRFQSSMPLVRLLAHQRQARGFTVTDRTRGSLRLLLFQDLRSMSGVIER